MNKTSEHDHASMSGRDLPLDRTSMMAAVLALLVSVAVSILAASAGFRVLPEEGPPARNAEVTRSLWRSGTIQPPEFQIFRRKFEEWSVSENVKVRQDVFAITPEGKLVPKHSAISAFVALPFFAVFGEAGFWICQQVFLATLVLAVFQIARRAGGDLLLPHVMVSLTALTQIFLGLYNYIFSYDFHGSTFLITGLMFYLGGSPFAGGLLMGLSAHVRITSLMMIPCLFLAQRRMNLLALAGLGCSLLSMFAFNYALFGSIFMTSYQNLPVFTPDGGFYLEKHPFGFDWQTFCGDWWRKLFDPEIGLIVYNPSLLAAPLVLRYSWRHPERRLLVAILASSLVYTLYVFSYEEWHTSFLGNRFLMPAVVLYSIPFSVWAAGLMHRLRRKAQ